jgi:hypothetical protein
MTPTKKFPVSSPCDVCGTVVHVELDIGHCGPVTLICPECGDACTIVEIHRSTALSVTERLSKEVQNQPVGERVNQRKGNHMPKQISKSEFKTPITLAITMPYRAWVRLGHLVSMNGLHDWSTYRCTSSEDIGEITAKITGNTVAAETKDAVLAALRSADANVVLNPQVVESLES